MLDRMLAKVPAERYAIPAEVADALAPWCAAADLLALLRHATEGGARGPGEERRSPPAGAARSRPKAAAARGLLGAEVARGGSWSCS